MKPPSNIEFIDKICCDFEKSWEFGLSLADVRKFVSGHVVENTMDFATLLVELAQIDIEHRWRYLAKMANRRSFQDFDALTSHLEAVPTARDYMKLLPPEAVETNEICDVLTDTELKARCKFGDSPFPATYGIPRELWGRYEKFMPRISIWQDDACRLEVAMCSPLLVGRQSVEDPNPPSMQYRQVDSKLICCPLSEKGISRHQIYVKTMIGNRVEIANFSKNRDFVVMKQSILLPEQSTYVMLPCTIDLERIKIRIRRPMLE